MMEQNARRRSTTNRLGELTKETDRSCGLLLAALATCLLLGGCAKAKPIHYYQITYPNSAVASANSIDVSIMVRIFLASHLYREDLIVFGSSAEEMGTYQNQRWAEPPTEMLQNALVRGMRASGRFRSVTMLRSDSQGDYVLSGHLYDFKEMDVNGVKAQLNFDVELRDVKGGKLVWTYAYNHDEPISGSNVAALATAMDKNVQRAVGEVQAGLEEYFRSHLTK
jgi:cholesterol transport system auxiliary component